MALVTKYFSHKYIVYVGFIFGYKIFQLKSNVT